MEALTSGRVTHVVTVVLQQAVGRWGELRSREVADDLLRYRGGHERTAHTDDLVWLAERRLACGGAVDPLPEIVLHAAKDNSSVPYRLDLLAQKKGREVFREPCAQVVHMNEDRSTRLVVRHGGAIPETPTTTLALPLPNALSVSQARAEALSQRVPLSRTPLRSPSLPSAAPPSCQDSKNNAG